MSVNQRLPVPNTELLNSESLHPRAHSKSPILCDSKVKTYYRNEHNSLLSPLFTLTS